MGGVRFPGEFGELVLPCSWAGDIALCPSLSLLSRHPGIALLPGRSPNYKKNLPDAGGTVIEEAVLSR